MSILLLLFHNYIYFYFLFFLFLFFSFIYFPVDESSSLSSSSSSTFFPQTDLGYAFYKANNKYSFNTPSSVNSPQLPLATCHLPLAEYSHNSLACTRFAVTSHFACSAATNLVHFFSHCKPQKEYTHTHTCTHATVRVCESVCVLVCVA